MGAVILTLASRAQEVVDAIAMLTANAETRASFLGLFVGSKCFIVSPPEVRINF